MNMAFYQNVLLIDLMMGRVWKKHSETEWLAFIFLVAQSTIQQNWRENLQNLFLTIVTVKILEKSQRKKERTQEENLDQMLEAVTVSVI